jgi:hypothetical protein
MRKILLFIAIIAVSACSDKEPAVVNLKKDKAIEVTFQTQKLGDTAVLLLTYQNVYLKGNLVKTMVKRDTLPSPGDSIQNVEVDDNEKTVRLPKEYEFFVTVK